MIFTLCVGEVAVNSKVDVNSYISLHSLTHHSRIGYML